MTQFPFLPFGMWVQSIRRPEILDPLVAKYNGTLALIYLATYFIDARERNISVQDWDWTFPIYANATIERKVASLTVRIETLERARPNVEPR